MAARYAKLTVRAGWSYNDSFRGNQTQQVTFRLANLPHTIQRGGSAGQFAVPDPDDITPPREFVLQGLHNLAGVVRGLVVQRSLPYRVSAVRDVGDDPTHEGGWIDGRNEPWPLAEFDIESTVYDAGYDDLNFSTTSQYGGWLIVTKLTTIYPVIVGVASQPATIYGSATGAATLSASGNGAIVSYVWSDGVTGSTRQNMAAGVYYCTVTDSLGESARVTVRITSDPQLLVQVTTGPDSCTLVPRGGLPPYAYAWADGATTATRTNLADGTYDCVVSDARGATRHVQVVISRSNRYWLAGNPITLPLTAADPDTTSFVCEVYVEPDYLSGTFELAGQPLEQPATTAGTTLFEVQELLQPYVARAT